jgi:purine-binding chemotaxis protein CheW
VTNISGRGLESYALAAVLKRKYPQSQLRICAHDLDLLNISAAPSIILLKEQIPRYIVENDFVKQGPQGYGFAESIKDSIFFEYHNILHRNEYPPADIILARDILSFLEPADQERLIEEFLEKLKPGGILIPGQNETIQGNGWFRIVQGDAVAYKKVEP